jgi:hypothetical protein
VLTLLLHRPKQTLVLAIATGMAAAMGISRRRGCSDVLATLEFNSDLCSRACEAVLEHWVQSARAGDIDEAHFEALLDRIVRIARAS